MPKRAPSTFNEFLIAATLVFGGIVATWGATRLDWPACVHWSLQSLVRTGVFLAAAAVVLSASAWSSGRSVWLMAGIAAFVIATASKAGGPFLWTVVLALSFTVLGLKALGAAGLTPSCRAVRYLISLALGSTLFGALVEICASLPVHHPAVYAMAVVIPIVAWRRQSQEVIASVSASASGAARRHPGLLVTESSVASLGLLYSTSALFPETEHDALLMHLAIPAEMSRDGLWHFDHQNFCFALMPKLANWLYSMGYMLGGEASARLVNCGFVLAGACAVYWVTRTASVRWRHWWGLAAAALFLSTPLAYREATSLFVESVWTYLVLAAALVCIGVGRSPQRGAALTAACVIMCGAAATKPQGLVTCAAFTCAFGPWILGAARQLTLRQGALIMAALAFVAATPYFRAWIETGNPVYPFFNGVFKAAGFPPETVMDMWQSPVDWRLLYRLTFESGKFLEGYPGAAGFQWILLLPAALLACVASRNRLAMTLAVFGLFTFAAMFMGSKYLRYVFPAMALLVTAIGSGLSGMGPRWRLVPVALAVACIGMNGMFLHAAGRKYPEFPIETLVLGSERQTFLERRAPIRLAVATINCLNRDASAVAFLSPAFGAELGSMPLYANHINLPFLQALAGADSAERLAECLCNRRVAYVIIDGSWRDDRVRAMLEEITSPVARFGDVQVRHLGEQRCLMEEALSDPDFSKGAWMVPPGTQSCSGLGGAGVRVTSDQPATQRIPARAGFRYVLSIDATGSAPDSLCRTQVVWLDGRGRTVRVDIEVFVAKPEGATHTMRGRAPADAVLGVVYATSHDLRPLCVSRASLRWAP